MGKNEPAPAEQPRNGVAGLKHWRYDLTAGLMVSLVSLPFSLGIAVASGAPPVAGLISAIIAGMIYPFLGGSYVTISGPAAGLAPALLAGMIALGHGDRAVGYPLLLGVICITGCVQIVLSLLKAARYSALFPSSVVEGMLAAIGMLIIAKELPLLIGHDYEAHGFFGILAETPSALLHMEPTVLLLGVFCLGLFFLLGSVKFRSLKGVPRPLKAVPPPLIVVLVGIGLGRLLGIGSQFNIHVPNNVLEHGLVLPNFHDLLADRALWWMVVTTVVTLTLIDGVESLATIAAIDKIDPFKRKSAPNRTLLAMGLSNICSSLAGGLTIIPGGVKSTVCIVTGGRTLWANFYNAVFLLLFLFFAKDLINLIPLSALAAIVIYIGYKLCAVRVWRRVAHVGAEQLLIFSVTVVTTLFTDLLVGIGAGMLAKLLVSASFTWSAAAARDDADLTLGGAVRRATRCITELFRDPLTKCERQGDTYHLHFGRPLSCFNLLHVRRALAEIPPEARTVCLHLSDGVTLIDHTSSANLMNFVREYEQSGKGQVEIVGLDQLQKRSPYETCMRIWPPALLPIAEGMPINGYASKDAAWPSRDGWMDIIWLALAKEDVGTPHDDLARMSLVPSGAAESSPSEDFDRMSLL